MVQEMEEMVGEITARSHWVGASLLPGALLHHPRSLLVLFQLFQPIRLSPSFRVGLGEEKRREFDRVIDYFSRNLSPVAKEMTFLLGFYVSNKLIEK